MDQYKNQYKEETSQIYAPAALLERTRLAVAEEEEKLQAEKVRDEQSRTGRTDHHRNYGRRYRWALSAAAAVILLFAVHRSALLWGTGAGKSSMDSASGMAASGGSEGDGSMSGSAEGASGGMEGETGSSSAETEAAEEADGIKFADTGAGEYAELQSAPAKTEDSASASREPDEDISGGRASGTAQSSGLNRDVSGGMADADKDDSANGYNDADRDDKADGYNDADRDDSADRPDDAAGSSSEDQVTELEKKYKEENSTSQISLTEVDRKPNFCDRTDTKRVVSQGIVFYVTESVTADTDASVDSTEAEKDGWRAYAEYKGKKYIMTGQAEDRDGFLEKACDTLMETAGGNSN